MLNAWVCHLSFWGPIGWMSRSQGCVATSTCQAEYMALGTLARGTVWVIYILEELIGMCLKVKLYCNNTAAVKVAMDLHFTKKSHRVSREFCYVNEQIYNCRVLSSNRVVVHFIEPVVMRH